jgi:hypothetical protein
MISRHKYDLEIKKMIIFVNVMLILCLFMSITQTDRQTKMSKV